jgi:hypothetical protein
MYTINKRFLYQRQTVYSIRYSNPKSKNALVLKCLQNLVKALHPAWALALLDVHFRGRIS